MIDNDGLVPLHADLREWDRISEGLRMRLSPAMEAHEKLQGIMGPAIEQFKALQEELKPIAAKFAELQQSIEVLVGPALERIEEGLRDLPDHAREALILLGEHGWYLDLNMPLPALWRLRKAISEGNLRDAEEALVAYFDTQLEKIERSIAEGYPRRAHLVTAAFKAHRRGEFDLSIPVLLAQTDGICKEVTGHYFFMARDGKPGTAIYVEEVLADAFEKALLAPLGQKLPVNFSAKDRHPAFNALNRHTVLHGESLDYGSKMNSLKGISLINYVAAVLRFKDENCSQGNPPPS